VYVRLAFILGGLEGTNLLLTLLIQWYVITELGVGIETDALFAGMALPQLILIVVSLSLTHVLVPLLATEDEETFRRDAWGFFLGISALLPGLRRCSLRPLTTVPLLFPGFTEEGQALTITLTRVQVVSMIFTAAVSVLWSVPCTSEVHMGRTLTHAL
jgi:putative peptidoglycan lipid II flippase